MEIQTSDKFIEFLKSRKSIRNFIFKKIDNDTIRDILECGRWAPSGQNNQPWKVTIVIHPTVKRMLAELTTSGGIIESAYVNLAVFLDLEKIYDRVKDIQSIGAFIENILLAVHAKGLGAVWIGEILKNKEKVNEIFKYTYKKYELMGVIAIGVIDEAMEKKNEEPRIRMLLDEFIEWF